MKILLEVSARHAHFSRSELDLLFGKNYKLHIKKYLSQPGQFLSEEKINIEVSNLVLENISILGPERNQTQIEISMTDARRIKINPPIRESGDLSGSPGCNVYGPLGKIKIKTGIIIAKRHVHLHPKDAHQIGFSNGEICSLKIENTSRPLIFGGVVVRINSEFSLAAHIDTDEANAACINGNSCVATIITSNGALKQNIFN
ncbi:MAG: phosphate propanoyltransferase [Oscillospiraceae bacterium]|jgi:putative phosphotransacetylase|nr:phosphate propanoyltransferase [Oscillospiraceae bacterium]